MAAGQSRYVLGVHPKAADAADDFENMKGRNTLIVEVKFYRESAKAYVGRGYSYETDMALNVGDRVLVPAGKGKNRAIVVAVNVPRIAVNPDYFPLKCITEYDMPEVNA